VEFKAVGRNHVPPARISTIRGLHVGGIFSPPNPGAEFKGATLRGVSFAGAKIDYFSATSSRFIECDFQGALFGGGRLSENKQTVYERCIFGDLDRSDLQPHTARFLACAFGNLKDWFCNRTEFVDCRFTGSLEKVVFYGRTLEDVNIRPTRHQNEFKNNDFTRTSFIDSDFRMGIDIDAQIWPDDLPMVTIRNFSDRISHAFAEVETWSNSDEREHGLLILRTYQDSYQGQDVVFFRADEIEAQKATDVFGRLMRILLQ
jgi:hypothetical protein